MPEGGRGRVAARPARVSDPPSSRSVVDPGHGGHPGERGHRAEREAGVEQRAQVQRVVVVQARRRPRGPRRAVGDDDGAGDLGQVDRVDAGDRGPRADGGAVAARGGPAQIVPRARGAGRRRRRGTRRAALGGSPQWSRAARPSGERHATSAGPGIGMTEGSTASARSVSAAQPSGVAALTASVKNMAGVSRRSGHLTAGTPARRQGLAADQPQPGLGDGAEVERLHLLVRRLPGGLPGLSGRQGGDRRGHLRRGLPDPALVVDRLRARPVPDHRHGPGRHALGRGHVERLVVAGRQDEPDPAQPGGHVRARRRRTPRRRAAAASAAPGGTPRSSATRSSWCCHTHQCSQGMPDFTNSRYRSSSRRSSSSTSRARSKRLRDVTDADHAEVEPRPVQLRPVELQHVERVRHGDDLGRRPAGDLPGEPRVVVGDADHLVDVADLDLARVGRVQLEPVQVDQEPGGAPLVA